MFGKLYGQLGFLNFGIGSNGIFQRNEDKIDRWDRIYCRRWCRRHSKDYSLKNCLNIYKYYCSRCWACWLFQLWQGRGWRLLHGNEEEHCCGSAPIYFVQMQFLLHIGFGHTWWWLDTNICELLLDQMLGFSLHIVFFLIYQMHFYKARPAEQCMLDSFTLHWMKQMKFICLLFEKSTLNRIKFPILDPILEKKRFGAESQTRGGSIAHDLYSRKKGRWDQIGY